MHSRCSEFRGRPRPTQKASERRRREVGLSPARGIRLKGMSGRAQLEQRWATSVQEQRIRMSGRGENMEAAESGFRPAPKARLGRLWTLSSLNTGCTQREV